MSKFSLFISKELAIKIHSSNTNSPTKHSVLKFLNVWSSAFVKRDEILARQAYKTSICV